MTKRTIGLAIVMAAALVLTSCASDGDSATSNTSNTSIAGDPKADNVATPPTVPGYDEMFADIGQADDGKAPIRVGFYSMENGTPSFPDATTAFNVAVEYVNTYLGGINGHPMEVVSCSAGVDPASNLECAQKFANDDNLNVVSGGVAIGSSNALPVFEKAELALVEAVPTNDGDYNSPVVLSYYGGGLTTGAGAIRYATDNLDAKKITFVGPDDAAGKGAQGIAEATAKSEGVELKTVLVPATTADSSGLLLGGGVKDSDVVVIAAPPPVCLTIAKGLEQLGVKSPVISSPSCYDKSVLTSGANGINGWYIVQPGPSPDTGAGEDSVVDLMNRAYDEFNGGTRLTEGVATASFGNALAIWMAAKDLENDDVPTRAQWLTALKGFTGPVPLGARTASCTNESLPALCVDEAWVYQVADRQLRDFKGVVNGAAPQ